MDRKDPEGGIPARTERSGYVYVYTLAVPILVPSYPYPNYSSYRNKSASFASYSKLYLQRWGFVKFVVTGRLDWNDFRLSSPFLLAFFP